MPMAWFSLILNPAPARGHPDSLIDAAMKPNQPPDFGDKAADRTESAGNKTTCPRAWATEPLYIAFDIANATLPRYRGGQVVGWVERKAKPIRSFQGQGRWRVSLTLNPPYLPSGGRTRDP